METVDFNNDTEDNGASPKIIGLTGGIGSGKSTVAQYIENCGFPVYYSDERAKILVEENSFVRLKIKALLGDEAYNNMGNYDRKYVGNLVFKDDSLLAELNAIIHPAVREDFYAWIKQQNQYMIFKETALLFELGLNKDCYKSLLVTAEDNLRIKRVMDRDQKTYREVEAVIHHQMPEKDKIKLADYVIYNNTTLEDLREQTEKIIFEIE